MRVLVTGSSGHLGEVVVRTLESTLHQAVGLDRVASSYTRYLGSIADREFVRRCLKGVDAVVHAATLHKPHMATHRARDFIDTNIAGTLTLLEEAVAAGVRAFVFTSTTSAFGDALFAAPDAAAVWVTEDVRPVPKNIYGVTKTAAEDLCEMIHRRHRLPCIILRTSRFFPEADDDATLRRDYQDGNLKANEYLYRRVDLQDAADAHLLAIERAPLIGFGRYIISATTPFQPEDLSDLRSNAPQVVRRRVPDYEGPYAGRGWRMFPGIDRVYVNERARRELGWLPKYDFCRILDCLKADEDFRSPLARAVGSKGYHDQTFAQGPYPVS